MILGSIKTILVLNMMWDSTLKTKNSTLILYFFMNVIFNYQIIKLSWIKHLIK